MSHTTTSQDDTLIKLTNLSKPKYEPKYQPSHIITRNLASYRGDDLYFDPVDEPSLTMQQFAAETDINNIIAQYEVSGLLTSVNPHTPTQGDFSDFGPGTDFTSAQLYLAEARQSFDALPAKVRARFHNNPAELLDFVGDPENEHEARKLGLLNPLPEKQPEAVPEASQPKNSKEAPPTE